MAAYGGGAGCAFLSAVPSAVAALVAIWAVWSMARDLRRYAWLSSASAVVELRRNAEGGWQLWLRNGRVVPASLKARTYTHPWMVALVFCTAHGRSVRVPVLVDMVDRDVFRRLRMALRTRQ